MNVVYEFRVLEEFAPLLFGEHEGEHLGQPTPIARRIFLRENDPRLLQVAYLQKKLNAEQNASFFLGWKIHREYTSQEIDQARVFSLSAKSYFEPWGSACGTTYSRSRACKVCGGGAEQMSDLFLDISKVPKRRHLASTVANEWIVSKKLWQQLQKTCTGVRFGSVIAFETSTASKDWFQMIVNAPVAVCSEQTLFGNEPFDVHELGKYRCSIPGLNHIAGLNILSEVFIASESHNPDYDLVRTDVLVGGFNQFMRPLVLASPQLFRLLRNFCPRDFTFEVAHSV